MSMSSWLVRCYLVLLSLTGPIQCRFAVAQEGAWWETQQEDYTERLEPLNYTGIREISLYPVGIALRSDQLIIPQFRQVFEHAFNLFTPKYEFKMSEIIGAGPGQYNWQATDRLIEYSQAVGIPMHGHVLIWDHSTPTWLNEWNDEENDVTFEEHVWEYITTIMQRYKGVIQSWDVVNEAFEDSTGNLQDNTFRQHMGDDYIARLFQYARAADPDALLFYNDYGAVWDLPKRAAILGMIDDLNARGIAIDGIGLQMHISFDFPPLFQIREALAEFVSRGLKVHFSELDVRANAYGDITEFTEERALQQKKRITEVIKTYNALPEENRFAITLWGLRDQDSWLVDFWGRPDWPLLFDNEYKPKPAYFGFVDGFVYPGPLFPESGQAKELWVLGDDAEHNYISAWTRNFGLGVAGLLGFLVMVAILMLNCHEYDPRQGQENGPRLALGVVCLGSLVETVAIPALSFDEDAGWDDRQLDLACKTTPWLFLGGHTLIFCGMILVLARQDTSGRRLPHWLSICVLVILTVASLLVWTLFEPWSWKRVILTPSPPETYAKCTSENEVLYLGLITIVALVAVVLVARAAWVQRGNQNPWVGRAGLVLGSYAQTVFICLPILSALHVTVTDGIYLARVLAIATLAGAPICLFVIPFLVSCREEPFETSVEDESEALAPVDGTPEGRSVAGEGGDSGMPNSGSAGTLTKAKSAKNDLENA